MSDPAKIILQNQFGEESINNVLGSLMPLVPDSNVVMISGAGVPTNGGSGTGHGVADKGSLYIDLTNGSLYQNTNTLSSPTWVIFEAGSSSVLATALTGFSSGAGTVSAADTILQAFNKLVGNTQNKTVLANLLSGFVAGAGTVSSADSVLGAFQKLVGNQSQLQNGQFTPTSETVSAAGAISTTVMETLINNASGSGFAVTLAAPSSQDGQLKIIKMGTAIHAATLAMTNIATSGAYTATGTTTLTFTSTGDCAVLMAVGSKWQYLGGSAVAS